MKNKIAKKNLEIFKENLLRYPEPNIDWDLITSLEIAINAIDKLDMIKFNVYASNELLKDEEDDNNG